MTTFYNDISQVKHAFLKSLVHHDLFHKYSATVSFFRLQKVCVREIPVGIFFDFSLPYVSSALHERHYVICPTRTALCHLPYTNGIMSPPLHERHYVICPTHTALCHLPYTNGIMSSALHTRHYITQRTKHCV